MTCHDGPASQLRYVGNGVRDPFQEQLAAGFDPDLYCPRQCIEERLIDLGRQDQLADLRRRRNRQPILRPD